MEKRSGIIEIRNLLTDRCLCLASEDTFSDCASIRFSLDLGTYPLASLQEDYTNTGLEVFEIREAEYLPRATGEELQAALEKHLKSCGLLYE